jgi:iron-sulfur cluster repair protein YtfE (RIC family)
MSAIVPSLKVSDIASVWPATMKVFAHYHIDLCCGGQFAVSTVAEKHHLDLAQFLIELNAAVKGEVPAP